MTKFTVTISRSADESAELEVEARSQAEAEESIENCIV